MVSRGEASVEVFHEGACLDGIEALFEQAATHSAIAIGDVHRVLRDLPGGVFQTCVTSPPYWSLRDYGLDGQIGLEPTVTAYIEALVSAFEEVRRVLRDDGTLWLNIGDSYTSGGRTWRAPDRKNPGRAMDTRPKTPDGLKPKDLIGVPWRLAFKLQEAGWFLRTEIIWNKPNAQPESVGDRPTRSHEYVFLLSKSERYYYDIEGVRGPNNRRQRTVWDINTQVAPGETNFAVFPAGLVERCVLSSTRPTDIVLDPFFGTGTTGVVAREHGRRFLGVELNPAFVEIATKRLACCGHG
ncbi:MAG: site-specific DNA-methyltransferase [Dehalococcoidia bacterium]